MAVRFSKRIVDNVNYIPIKISPSDKIECDFCKRYETKDECYDNDLYSIGPANGKITCHFLCVLYSRSTQTLAKKKRMKEFRYRDIKNDIERSLNRRCDFCRKNGATAGCINIRCLRAYHLPCGLQSGKIKTYEDKHKGFTEIGCATHEDHIFKKRITKRLSERWNSSLGSTDKLNNTSMQRNGQSDQFQEHNSSLDEGAGPSFIPANENVSHESVMNQDNQSQDSINSNNYTDNKIELSVAFHFEDGSPFNNDTVETIKCQLIDLVILALTNQDEVYFSGNMLDEGRFRMFSEDPFSINWLLSVDLGEIDGKRIKATAEDTMILISLPDDDVYNDDCSPMWWVVHQNRHLFDTEEWVLISHIVKPLDNPQIKPELLIAVQEKHLQKINTECVSLNYKLTQVVPEVYLPRSLNEIRCK